MKYLQLFVVLLCFTACKHHHMGESRMFVLEDFKSVELQESNATVYLNDDLLLGNPMQIKYHPDGYIILFDRKPEGLITVIDLQTNKINYYVNRGRGPLELGNVKDLSIRNGDVWISSPNDRKLLRLENISEQRSFSIKQEGQIETGFLRAVPYGQNNILTLPLGRTSDRFYMLNNDRVVIDTLGVMPSVANIDIQPTNGIYQSNLNISPDNKHIVTACVNFESIDIYNEYVELVCSLSGPYGLNSGVKKRSFGTGYQIVHEPMYFTFTNIVSSNDTFEIGFLGEKPQSDDEISDLGITRILSFNWNGKPLKMYNLPEKIRAFDIDYINKKLYCITKDAEPQIMIYNL